MGRISEISEFANSTAGQRMDALFYMQSHWIKNENKLMDITDDFYLNFITLLNKHEVEYLLIGGFAVNFHGYARTTHDMDLWINPEKANSARLLTAIDEFGFDVSILKGVYLAKQEPIKLPHDTISFKKIEILADISGVYDFQAAYNNKVDAPYNDISLKFIGYDDLIKNKLSSAPPKDYNDLHTLKLIAEERKLNAPIRNESNTLKRKKPQR